MIADYDGKPITDLTGRVAFSSKEPHPYKTNTRFVKVDGKWEPLQEAKRAPEKGRSEDRGVTAHDRADGVARIKEERRVMAKALKRIAKRQAIGDPDCRASEAEDFPLLEALRREGREDMVATVLRYRRLVALCEAEPLKGLDYTKSDGGEVVRETKRLTPEADIDKAAASNWSSVPDGEIKISTKVKRSKGAYSLPAKRKVVAANDNIASGCIIKTESLHVKLTDEVLNDHIDAKPILEELRRELGPLVDVFEDAVLGGRSYSDVGRDSGEESKPAVAGKALIGMACGTISVKWQEIDRREKALAELALHRFRNRAA